MSKHRLEQKYKLKCIIIYRKAHKKITQLEKKNIIFNCQLPTVEASTKVITTYSREKETHCTHHVQERWNSYTGDIHNTFD